ncbi:MAG: 16S rRNA (guanine(527)-N(7))-methyltransferase RsmG [Fibrobacterota bacterium]|nr:16S rRNA (guanine(527)-N(7))-methyltransferase RsmG [Fibrobacterota bacterium]
MRPRKPTGRGSAGPGPGGPHSTGQGPGAKPTSKGVGAGRPEYVGNGHAGRNAPQGQAGNIPRGGGFTGKPIRGKRFPPQGQSPPIQPSKPALGQLMARYGVHLQPQTLDHLWAYHQLLRENNHDQDLTRLIGFETIAQRHYADCMILHGLMKGKWPSPMVDVGTGAGFPGIMLKLMSPSTTIVLAEPRPRRVQFLEMVIRELGLKDISVFGHKVTSRSLTQPFEAAITRAFESVEHTLPRFGSCLPVGGKAIFMKGPKAVEEMAVFHSDEYKVVRNHAYRIPNTTQDRVLLILERTKVPEDG